MTQAIIDEFIDAMFDAGCGPASASDIIADDKGRYIDGADDRRGTKKIKYILKIEDGRGIGGFINYRFGDWHTWVSSAPKKKFTDEEREEWRKKVEDAKLLRAEEQENEFKEAAKAARAIWDGAVLAPPDHPYLVRKKIKGHGARLHEGNLLIPMYFSGKFLGYQTIAEDGEKLYLKGGRKHGCFYPLANKDDSKDKIVICEGFATGASIREATGLVTIVAFDKGNLEPVSKAYREKYPKAHIFIAADNDQWSFKAGKKPKDFDRGATPGDDPIWLDFREQGLLYNPGILAAEQAAVKIKGYTVWPDFSETSPDKPTDFNDLHVQSGLEKVAEYFTKDTDKKIVKKPALPRTGTWEDEAIKRFDKYGNFKIDPTRSFNYYLCVEGHAQLYKIFAWDEFQLCVMVIKMPPWHDEKKQGLFKVHPLGDNDIIHCDYFLQNIGLAGAVQSTRAAIYAAARKNSIHPARDYFNALKWDGTPRLDEWLIKYCFCTQDDQEYVRAVGRTWLIAAVKRVYEPGCKFDHMLILEGDQSVGKSTTLKAMASFGQDDGETSYFNDTFRIKNLENKDELAKLRGVLIVELQELAGFNKQDRDALTAFVTTVQDEYRRPYGFENEKYPRQFVLAGTYNPVAGIFSDPTGYRRYWCVTVTKKIDIDGLKQAREQIWAEAVHRYKAGESLVLSESLYKKAHEAGHARRIVDDWTVDVLNAFGNKNFMEVRDIMQQMGIEIRGRTQQESRRISNILKSEGYSRVQKRVGSKTVWGWEKPGHLSAPEQYSALRRFEEREEDAGEEIEF